MLPIGVQNASGMLMADSMRFADSLRAEVMLYTYSILSADSRRNECRVQTARSATTECGQFVCSMPTVCTLHTDHRHFADLPGDGRRSRRAPGRAGEGPPESGRFRSRIRGGAGEGTWPGTCLRFSNPPIVFVKSAGAREEGRGWRVIRASASERRVAGVCSSRRPAVLPRYGVACNQASAAGCLSMPRARIRPSGADRAAWVW